MIVRLIRKPSTDEGTFGELRGFDFEFYTAELPDRLNAKGKSCIPGEAVYRCVWQNSPRFGWTYEVTGVPNRDRVLIHAGNFAGDKDRGLKSDVEGCILLGLSHGVLTGQRAVLRSREALKQFHAHMKEQDFELHITWGGK